MVQPLDSRCDVLPWRNLLIRDVVCSIVKLLLPRLEHLGHYLLGCVPVAWRPEMFNHTWKNTRLPQAFNINNINENIPSG